MNLTEGIFNELSEKSYETFVKKYSLASVLNQENQNVIDRTGRSFYGLIAIFGANYCRMFSDIAVYNIQTM